MSSRSPICSAGALLKVTGYLLTALLIADVGGPALVVLVVSVLLTAAAMQRRVQFRAGVGVLAALVLNLTWLAIFMGALLPLVLSVPGLRRLVAHPLEPVGFQAITYPSNSVGLFWLGSLLVLGTPGIVSVIVLVRGRARFTPFGEPLMGGATWLAALLPFAVVAVLNRSEPWLALASTMGGDGRNHFLVIQEIRATASGVPSPLSFTTPALANAIGALISSGNGSSGILQRGDVLAIVSVYVLSASIIIVATLTGFYAASRGGARWSALPLVGAAFLLATNSFVLSTSLRDGFLTLYFGTAVLGASLVLAALLPIGRAKLLVVGCSVISQIGSYAFLAPVLGAVLMVESFRWVWAAAPPGRRTVAVVAWSASITAGVAVVVLRNWSSFESVAAIPGAVSPVEPDIMWILLAVAVTMWSVGTAAIRAAGLTATVALATCWFVLFFIERLPGNSDPGYSYYASKTLVGTVGGVLCLSFVPLGRVLAAAGPTGFRRIAATVGMTAGALVPVAIVEGAAALPRPWSDVRNGQASPDASSIDDVVDHWGDDPHLFFRFADNPPLVEFPSIAADRMLDFWTPTAWGRTGRWSAIWQWVYDDMASPDASVLCAPIRSGVGTVYTRDAALRDEVTATCGASDVNIVVLPREGSP